MSAADVSARPKPGDGSTSRERFAALHEEIRERICLLRYPPGMPLGEEALAAEFGVSRTPIRRVLSVLEAEGLVESRHGVATMVTMIELPRLREIYALRMRLAELIGELDPQPRGVADLARLRGLIARCDALRVAPDLTEYYRLNMAFTRELMQVTGNGALRDVSLRLYYQASRFFPESLMRMDLLEEIAIFRSEMADILGALERGDFRAVGFVRRNHIAWSFDRMTREGPRPGVLGPEVSDAA